LNERVLPAKEGGFSNRHICLRRHLQNGINISDSIGNGIGNRIAEPFTSNPTRKAIFGFLVVLRESADAQSMCAVCRLFGVPSPSHFF
jgi:hypothetical protein